MDGMAHSPHSTRMRGRRLRGRSVVFAGALALVVGVAGMALAASPGSGGIGPSNRSTGWKGKSFLLGAVGSPGACAPPDRAGLCDHYYLSVNVASSYWN